MTVDVSLEIFSMAFLLNLNLFVSKKGKVWSNFKFKFLESEFMIMEYQAEVIANEEPASLQRVYYNLFPSFFFLD